MLCPRNVRVLSAAYPWPNVVTERKSRSESQDASKNIAPLFNHEGNGVRCCNTLQIRRSFSVTPQEVSADAMQGVCRRYARCLQMLHECLHFAARESVDYLYSRSAETPKLLVTCTAPLLVDFTTPTTLKENSQREVEKWYTKQIWALLSIPYSIHLPSPFPLSLVSCHMS